MFEWLQSGLMGPLISTTGSVILFVLANFSLIAGFICASVILRRISTERRSPSNTFAWLLLVVFLPFLGVPLYLLFGGRKSRRMTRIKSEMSRQADLLAHPMGDRTHPGRERLFPAQQPVGAKGNHCELLADGSATFERLCHEIEQAEHTIHIATYILGNDRSGQAIVNLLARRASEGVRVRLLLDSLGSWNRTRLARLKIRAAGGQVAMFMPVFPLQPRASANLRNHRKMAIFDNYRAITGGQNLDDRFLGNWPDRDRFTDFSIVTQGPVVAELTRTFIADWSFAAKESPEEHRELLQYVPEEAGNSTMDVIASGPDVANDPLWENIVRIAQEFRRELIIVTPYFIPDEVLLQSLIIKAHTGRRIHIFLPLHSNQRLADIARVRSLTLLHAAGVEIRFFRPGMLHAKLVIADGIVALTGSANIDMRSLFVNFEIALAHYTRRDIEKLERWVEGIHADCIPYAEAVDIPGYQPSRLKLDLVRLIEPLL